MSIDKISLSAPNIAQFSGNTSDKLNSYSDEKDVFTLKFEPASFGGKDYHNNTSTSIFDDWDS